MAEDLRNAFPNATKNGDYALLGIPWLTLRIVRQFDNFGAKLSCSRKLLGESLVLWRASGGRTSSPDQTGSKAAGRYGGNDHVKTRCINGQARLI